MTPVTEATATGVESAERKKGTQFKEGEEARPGPGRGKKTDRPNRDEPFNPPRDHKAENKNSTRGKLADELGFRHACHPVHMHAG